MIKLALIGIIFLVIQCSYTSAQLNVVYEDITFPTVNKKYIGMVDAYFTEDNAIAGNLSIIKMFPEDTLCRVYMLGDSMGEYVVPAGIDVEMSLCEMINEPIVLGSILKVFGFREDECPPKLGLYSNEGYMIPTENFPESFTTNKYLFVVDLYSPNETIITMHIFFDIQL